MLEKDYLIGILQRVFHRSSQHYSARKPGTALGETHDHPQVAGGLQATGPQAYKFERNECFEKPSLFTL